MITANVEIRYYHYDEIESTFVNIPVDNPKWARKHIEDEFRYSRYTSAKLHFVSCKRTKWGYSIVVEQNGSGSRTQEQVAMENERFHKAQELSKNADDMNEVYANMEYLEGRSV